MIDLEQIIHRTTAIKNKMELEILIERRTKTT